LDGRHGQSKTVVEASSGEHIIAKIDVISVVLERKRLMLHHVIGFVSVTIALIVLLYYWESPLWIMLLFSAVAVGIAIIYVMAGDGIVDPGNHSLSTYTGQTHPVDGRDVN
jgi:hypothetical protein